MYLAVTKSCCCCFCQKFIKQVRCFRVTLDFSEYIEVKLVKETFHDVIYKNDVRFTPCYCVLFEGFFINTDAVVNTRNGLKPVALDNFPELFWKGQKCKVTRFTRGTLQRNVMDSVGFVIITACLEILFFLDGC